MDILPKLTHVEKVRAGHREDLKIPVVSVPECIHVRILGGEPSVGGHVGDQHHLARVLGQADVAAAIQGREAEL